MEMPEAKLIQEILEMRNITIRKLASVTKIKESTMVRLLSGVSDGDSSRAISKLTKYKSRISNPLKASHPLAKTIN